MLRDQNASRSNYTSCTSQEKSVRPSLKQIGIAHAPSGAHPGNRDCFNPRIFLYEIDE